LIRFTKEKSAERSRDKLHLGDRPNFEVRVREKDRKADLGFSGVRTHAVKLDENSTEVKWTDVHCIRLKIQFAFRLFLVLVSGVL